MTLDARDAILVNICLLVGFVSCGCFDRMMMWKMHGERRHDKPEPTNENQNLSGSSLHDSNARHFVRLRAKTKPRGASVWNECDE